MGADVRRCIMVLHFHPCQRIGYLAGIGDLIPGTRLRILMIRKSRIKGSCRIKSLLIIEKIVIFLYRTEHTQLATDKITEDFLCHIHIGREILHILIQYHSLPVHIP